MIPVVAEPLYSVDFKISVSLYLGAFCFGRYGLVGNHENLVFVPSQILAQVVKMCLQSTNLWPETNGNYQDTLLHAITPVLPLVALLRLLFLK